MDNLIGMAARDSPIRELSREPEGYLENLFCSYT